MARKQYKVKHYYGRNDGSYRAKPHPVFVVFIVAALAGLVYLGTIIYQPVYDFVMNIGKLPDTSQSEPEPAASAPESSEPAEPVSPREPGASALRAVWLTPEQAADTGALDALLTRLKAQEINAVMLDVKDNSGRLLFQSDNELVLQWGASVENPLDLKAFADRLRQNDMRLIVRMQTFNDRIAARGGRHGYAIFYENTDYLWLDLDGSPWLNPYAADAKAYLTAIALEAVEAGAEMVALDEVRFPEGSGKQATFGAEADGIGRQQALHAFVDEITASLEEKNARVAVSLPAEVPESRWEVLYGGDPLTISGQNLMLGIASDAAATAATTQRGADVAVAEAQRRLMGAPVKIIPILDAAGRDAAEAFDEYVLYSADGAY